MEENPNIYKAASRQLCRFVKKKIHPEQLQAETENYLAGLDKVGGQHWAGGQGGGRVESGDGVWKGVSTMPKVRWPRSRIFCLGTQIFCLATHILRFTNHSTNSTCISQLSNDNYILIYILGLLISPLKPHEKRVGVLKEETVLLGHYTSLVPNQDWTRAHLRLDYGG